MMKKPEIKAKIEREKKLIKRETKVNGNKIKKKSHSRNGENENSTKKINDLKKKLDRACEFQDNCVAFVQELIEQLEDLQYWSPMNPVNWQDIEINLSQAAKQNTLLKHFLPTVKTVFKFLETLLEENSQFWMKKLLTSLKTKKKGEVIRNTELKNKKKTI